jgi:hypothetical protein
MNSNKLINLNLNYNPNKDFTKKPLVEDYDNTTLYMYDLEKYLQLTYINPLKVIILNFLNEWTKISYKKLTDFQKVYLKDLPSNSESKEYMIKNFTKLNEKFNLGFIYDEKIFTTFNVLFFLKNMLEKVNLLLYKEKIGDDKIYTIIFKKK